MGNVFAVGRTSLRGKFILVTIVVQIAVMGMVILVVESRQRHIILSESELRARSLAANLAALSEGDLLSYNFIRLEQTVERVAREADVAYAIVHVHNGQVAAYSGHPEHQGTRLHDAVSRGALESATLEVQTVAVPEAGGLVYDVAIPIYARGGTRKWGTVRLGYALRRALHEIHVTRLHLLLVSLVAIGLGTSGAVFLATRISRPIQQLVAGVSEVTRGNYVHPIAVNTRDEVGYLAQRFDEMRRALQRHVTHLATEKQRLERMNQLLIDTQGQLIQHEKLAAVGKLAARVAHEVNNPLAIIKTSFNVLSDKLDVDAATAEDLRVIEDEIHRIARIIRQLLDLTRPRADRVSLQVNDVIRDLQKLVAGELWARGIRLRLHLDSNLPRLGMSPDHLKQILLNLITNAQDAMPGGGRLVIRTAPDAGGVVITVADTGSGIPEAHLESIFEPFFTTKDQGEGMGLGLAVSSSIVKSYGGRLEVSSTVGQGTTLRVVLPAQPIPRVRPLGRHGPPSSSSMEG